MYQKALELLKLQPNENEIVGHAWYANIQYAFRSHTVIVRGTPEDYKVVPSALSAATGVCRFFIGIGA